VHALTGVPMATTFSGSSGLQPPTAPPAASPMAATHAEPSFVGANPAVADASARYRPIEEEATRGTTDAKAIPGANTTLASAQPPRVVPSVAPQSLGHTLAEGQSLAAAARAATATAPTAPTTQASPAPAKVSEPPPHVPIPQAPPPSKANLVAGVAIALLLVIALVLWLVFLRH